MCPSFLPQYYGIGRLTLVLPINTYALGEQVSALLGMQSFQYLCLLLAISYGNFGVMLNSLLLWELFFV